MKDGTKQFIHYTHQKDDPHSLMHSDLSCLYEDSRKNIWVGQRAGLSYFNKKQNSFHVIEPLKWNHITALQEHNDYLIIVLLAACTSTIIKPEMWNRLAPG